MMFRATTELATAASWPISPSAPSIYHLTGLSLEQRIEDPSPKSLRKTRLFRCGNAWCTRSLATSTPQKGTSLTTAYASLAGGGGRIWHSLCTLLAVSVPGCLAWSIGEVCEGNVYFTISSGPLPAKHVCGEVVATEEEPPRGLSWIATNTSSRKAIVMRDTFMAHFTLEGAVSWQPTE